MTTRRQLGTGPTTTRTTTPTGPRLLPAERAQLHADIEHQDVPEQKGRRNLGSGPADAT